MSVISSLARRLGGYRLFTLVGRAYVPIDRALGRLGKGRAMALGLPSLSITTNASPSRT